MRSSSSMFVWASAAALLGSFGCDDQRLPADQQPDGGATAGGNGGSVANAGGGAGAGAAGGTGGAPPPACSHDVCAVGDYLEASCNECSAAVCEADDWCCSIGWDEYCIQLVVSLSSICACAPETICSGLWDEDLDGLRDCADPDCAASCVPGDTPVGEPCTMHAECAPLQPICFDEEQQGWSQGYCSGFCDVDDPSSCGEAVCVTLVGGDGLELGACLRRCDPALPGECRPGYRCVEEAPEPYCAPIPEDCENGLDDDVDGEADCADSACHGAFNCFEVCDDGEDDNGDGSVDCADWSCRSHPTCLTWACAPAEQPAQTSCIEVGGAVGCHPISNEGCDAGRACDAHFGAYAFQCGPGPGTEPTCAPCGPDALCAPGNTCIATQPDLSDAECARFCCSSADCGGDAFCNKAVVTGIIGGIPSPVGVCMQAAR